MASCVWLFSKPPCQYFCCLSCKLPWQEFPFCLFHRPPCLGFGLWLSCKPPWQDFAFLQASLLELWPLAFLQASRPGDKASKASKLPCLILPNFSKACLLFTPLYFSLLQWFSRTVTLAPWLAAHKSGLYRLWLCALACFLMAFFNCQGRISPLHKGSSFFNRT